MFTSASPLVPIYPKAGGVKRRRRYDGAFKLKVVQQALKRPLGCRVKPTCRDFPGVDPVRDAFPSSCRHPPLSTPPPLPGQVQLRKWIKAFEASKSPPPPHPARAVGIGGCLPSSAGCTLEKCSELHTVPFPTTIGIPFFFFMGINTPGARHYGWQITPAVADWGLPRSMAAPVPPMPSSQPAPPSAPLQPPPPPPPPPPPKSPPMVTTHATSLEAAAAAVMLTLSA